MSDDLNFTDDELHLLADHWIWLEGCIATGGVTLCTLPEDLTRRGATPDLVERFARLRQLREAGRDHPLSQRFESVVGRVRGGRESS